ncbi:MAG: hypothetical protein K0V04_22255 [Deltaproteobacteria bacterium]|nr:hypothetical protein [Deltaproteobacteria bacterium]
MWVRSVIALATAFSLSACFAGDDAGASGGVDDDYMDDPPPGGGCATECPNPGSDGSPVGGPCIDSEDCMTGAICAAEFDGEVQSFTCTNACIPLMDQSQWCSDDTSCCAAGAVCSGRGLCLPAGATGGLDSSGGEPTTGTTGGADSGSSSGGSSSGTGGSGSSSATGGSSGSSSG